MTSWWASSPEGEPSGSGRRRPSVPLSPSPSPDGASTFALVVELDDLGPRQMPRGLLGESHHEHGAEREVRGDEARDALSAARARRALTRPSSVRPVVPTTQGTPAPSAPRTLASTASGAVKSTAASCPAKPGVSPISTPVTSCPAARAAARERSRPSLGAEQENAHRRQAAAASTSAGLTCSTASRNAPRPARSPRRTAGPRRQQLPRATDDLLRPPPRFGEDPSRSRAR